jgi:hypothetical protein
MGAASREEHASGVLTPKITQAQLRSPDMVNNEENIIRADSVSFSTAQKTEQVAATLLSSCGK